MKKGDRVKLKVGYSCTFPDGTRLYYPKGRTGTVHHSHKKVSGLRAVCNVYIDCDNYQNGRWTHMIFTHNLEKICVKNNTKESKKVESKEDCTCDFYKVVMVSGCKCGGK